MPGAQLPPDPGLDLAGFPDATLPAGAVVARAHNVTRGEWWFTSGPGGRFNLDPPLGTWYAADDIETALREKLRGRVTPGRAVPWDTAVAVAVTTLAVPTTKRCANCGDRRAVRFGVTRELAAAPFEGYAVSRRWAEAWRGAGFAGVRYESRFTTAPGPNAWALFGQAGDAEAPRPEVRSVTPGLAACLMAGLRVGCPTLADLTVLT
jgi:hypothetical protein